MQAVLKTRICRLAALLCGLLPAVAVAQSDPQLRGSLQATAYERLPADAEFHVRPASASPMAMGMAELLDSALLDAGYRLGGRAPYVLSFQVTGGSRHVSRGPRPQFTGGGGATDLSRGDMEFKLRFSSANRRPPKPSGNRLVLITVSDSANRLLWEARANVTAPDIDEYDIIQIIAPAVVEELGRSVYGRPLP